VPVRQLLLLRHAKSSWDDPRLSDHVRPLNARGREAAAGMREAMLTLGLAPDVVLVSSARRTLQTLEALLPFADTPLIEPMDALYLATAPQMLAVLNGMAETVRSVLLIGHNPGLHELARLLAGSARDPADAARLADKYPTAALAEFAVPGPWRTLGPGGARLIRFLCPRDLPLPA
jgi:phosphohistidine phosphatase